MRLKDSSVKPTGLHPKLIEALFVADELHRKATGKELTVTSLNDGKHKQGSLHYVGQAADLRTWALPRPDLFTTELQQALGNQYDVVLEIDHIHLEYDPR